LRANADSQRPTQIKMNHAGDNHRFNNKKGVDMTSTNHQQPAKRSAAHAAASLALFSAAAFIGTGAFAAPGGYEFTPIAYLGDPAPGGGEFIRDFEVTHLNNRGDLAFTVDLTTPGPEGVFLARGGTLFEVARAGMPAPGGGTFSDREQGYIGGNDEGDLAFVFMLEPPKSAPFIHGGLYRYSHITQTVTPVVVPDVTPAPGGGTFLGVGTSPSLNNQGTIEFRAFTAAAKGPADGIFLAHKSGRLETIVNSADGVFNLAATPWLNNKGDAAFIGHVASAPPGNSFYVKKAASRELITVAGPGDEAQEGGVILSAFVPRINSAGEAAFIGVLAFGTATTPELDGIFLDTGGVLHRVAGPGDAMPGGAHVTRLVRNTAQVGFNERGDLTFYGELDTSESGFYIYSKSSISLIARTGTVVPGVGTIFSMEMSDQPGNSVALNDYGQVGFGCTLADGRVVLLIATPHGTGAE